MLYNSIPVKSSFTQKQTTFWS